MRDQMRADEVTQEAADMGTRTTGIGKNIDKESVFKNRDVVRGAIEILEKGDVSLPRL
jgi:hypothetical protein